MISTEASQQSSHNQRKGQSRQLTLNQEMRQSIKRMIWFVAVFRTWISHFYNTDLYIGKKNTSQSTNCTVQWWNYNLWAFLFCALCAWDKYQKRKVGLLLKISNYCSPSLHCRHSCRKFFFILFLKRMTLKLNFYLVQFFFCT